MKTIFKNSKNQNVMGFSHEGLQGGFYLMGNPILATLNGPYPIRNLTEAEAVAKVRDITRDFLENTGKKTVSLLGFSNSSLTENALFTLSMLMLRRENSPSRIKT